MSINKGILKRIKAVESEIGLNGSEAPFMIWVDYDEDREVYTIKEQYMNGNGKIIKECCYTFKKLPEYVFHPKFDGVCLLDLYKAPIPEPNIYHFQGKDLRNGIEKGVGVTVDFEVEQPEDIGRNMVHVEVKAVPVTK